MADKGGLGKAVFCVEARGWDRAFWLSINFSAFYPKRNTMITLSVPLLLVSFQGPTPQGSAQPLERNPSAAAEGILYLLSC